MKTATKSDKLSLLCQDIFAIVAEIENFTTSDGVKSGVKTAVMNLKIGLEN
jgi:hypothetical protein